VAALAGADSLISAGGLDGVQISSLAKYVLDNDQVGALRRYLREDSIDETTALMDDILEVGIGGHFLGRRSTRQHARTEVWRPRAFRKGTFEESAGRPLAAEAAERARDILASHEVPPLSEDAERHIDAVIEQYARGIGTPGSAGRREVAR
jgi:trimethylamine---corrinoid protein Co-methyltransferase